jgi:hypothetical protein
MEATGRVIKRKCLTEIEINENDIDDQNFLLATVKLTQVAKNHLSFATAFFQYF